MRPLVRVLEEVQRNQWAILPKSLRSMLAILDGEELKAEDYRFFHAVAEDQKAQAAEIFGSPVDDTSYTSIDKNVGFLMVDGPIIPRATWFSKVSGLVSLDELTSEFKALEKNASIDTIVMLFDSPGGVVQGTSDFASLVRASSKRTISFTWMAASAAYWIASAADEIVSPTTGMVGSIGTVLSLTDYSEYYAKRGIKQIEIVSSQSPNKRPDPKTAEGKAVLQKLVDDLATVFVESVAEYREVTSQDVLNRFGAGAMVVARRAMEAGMVDSIMDAEAFAKTLDIGSNTLQGFQFSAQADTTAQEEEMGVKKEEEKKPMTAEELLKANPEAVEELLASAKADERKRLQSLEALADTFKGGLPSQKAAAEKVIAENKYKEDMTADKLASLVLEAVSKAGVDAVEAFGKDRREGKGAEAAAKAGKATPPSSKEEQAGEESNSRINKLVAARDAAADGR